MLFQNRFFRFVTTLAVVFTFALSPLTLAAAATLQIASDPFTQATSQPRLPLITTPMLNPIASQTAPRSLPPIRLAVFMMAVLVPLASPLPPIMALPGPVACSPA